jgi:UDPglucose 6-dehydrogenase
MPGPRSTAATASTAPTASTPASATSPAASARPADPASPASPASRASAALPISVFGAGYVGLVSAACMASLGHDVLCIDTDAARLQALRRGRPPFHEPGLPELLAAQLASGRLRFSGDAAEAVAHGRLLFIAVGTPPGEDGSADVRQVLAVAREMARHLRRPAQVVLKSTVPVGTGEQVRSLLQRHLEQRGVDLPVSVVSNPEFLREGTAIHDFMHPDRVVLGCDEPGSLRDLRALYTPLVDSGRPLLEMDLRSAEFTKYAANALLAVRLSAINELALLAEAEGADIQCVRAGVGSDARIGSAFLAPGCGYGGSCLPKDVAALLHAGMRHGLPLPLLHAVKAVNDAQKQLLVRRLLALCNGDIRGRRVAVWGLAFKPGTDDLREAPSLDVVALLRAEGAHAVVHDPLAMPGARRLLGTPPGLDYAADPLAAVDGADALLIVTDWPVYAGIAPEQLAHRMRDPVVLDGRNLFDPGRMADCGIRYRPIGRPSGHPFDHPFVRASGRRMVNAERFGNNDTSDSCVDSVTSADGSFARGRTILLADGTSPA